MRLLSLYLNHEKAVSLDMDITRIIRDIGQYLKYLFG